MKEQGNSRFLNGGVDAEEAGWTFSAWLDRRWLARGLVEVHRKHAEGEVVILRQIYGPWDI